MFGNNTFVTEQQSCQQRRKDNKLVEDESSNVNSSGYSSEGEEEGEKGDCHKGEQVLRKGDKNIIYYKVRAFFNISSGFRSTLKFCLDPKSILVLSLPVWKPAW